MTALANSRVFWTGLLAAPGGLVRPAPTIAVITHAENIPLAVILNCFPTAWPAALLRTCMMPHKEPR